MTVSQYRYWFVFLLTFQNRKIACFNWIVLIQRWSISKSCSTQVIRNYKFHMIITRKTCFFFWKNQIPICMHVKLAVAKIFHWTRCFQQSLFLNFKFKKKNSSSSNYVKIFSDIMSISTLSNINIWKMLNI